jgi:6,7-dimethyl-8-ribityllumazine synthase
MATVHHNLSDYNKEQVPSGADFKVGIVVSEWNDNITFNLLKGAQDTLLENGVRPENIHVYFVPGTFELPIASQMVLENTFLDGLIAIGCVIQGETKHFDFVCQGTTQGLMDVGLKYNRPVIFCVLTDNTMQQSIDRSGGKHGNKGVECAIALLKMVHLSRSF